MPPSAPPLRLGRALLVSLALVANLIAAGMPVIHAWVHEFGHHHHDTVWSAPAEVDHPHEEVHPLALHEECLLTHRAPLDLAVALPASGFALEIFGKADVAEFHPVQPVASRAPPGHNHARAPPLA